MNPNDYAEAVVKSGLIELDHHKEVEEFLDQRVDVLLGAHIGSRTLYNAYLSWTPYLPMTQTMFGGLMGDLGIHKKHTQVGNFYLHIVLRPTLPETA